MKRMNDTLRDSGLMQRSLWVLLAAGLISCGNSSLKEERSRLHTNLTEGSEPYEHMKPRGYALTDVEPDNRYATLIADVCVEMGPVGGTKSLHCYPEDRFQSEKKCRTVKDFLVEKDQILTEASAAASKRNVQVGEMAERYGYTYQEESSSWIHEVHGWEVSLAKIHNPVLLDACDRTLMPAIVFELVGGGNIAGSHVMVGGEGGQLDLLPDYSSLGLSREIFPQEVGVEIDFGLAWHPDSPMLQGMREGAGDLGDHMFGAVFCASSPNSTRRTGLHPWGNILDAGRTGTETGLATYGRDFRGYYSTTLPGLETPQHAAHFIDELVDPRQEVLADEVARQVFDENGGEKEYAVAAIAKTVLEGKAGVGSIELTGYTYVNFPRERADAKDKEAGILIGKVLKYASLKGQDIAIFVITDGGVGTRATETGRPNWNFESASRSASLMFVHRAHETQVFDATKSQVGHYNSRGEVDRKNLVGLGGDYHREAMLVNYLSFDRSHEEIRDLLQEIAPNSLMNQEFEDYLAFD